MADTAEEHKHQPFKNGAHFTFGMDSCNQLVDRDLLVSTLRHLLHGGTFGDGEKHQLAAEFREFKHPILKTVSCYSSSSFSEPFPSKFLYTNKPVRKVTVTLSEEERQQIATLLGVTLNEVETTATPCRRMTLNEATNYEVGDVVSYLPHHADQFVPLSLSLSLFLSITSRFVFTEC